MILEDAMTTIEMRKDPLDGVWRDHLSRWLEAQKMEVPEKAERPEESQILSSDGGEEPEGETVELAPISGSALEPRWRRIFPSL